MTNPIPTTSEEVTPEMEANWAELEAGLAWEGNMQYLAEGVAIAEIERGLRVEEVA